MRETTLTTARRLDVMLFAEPDVTKAKETLIGLLDATMVVRGDCRNKAGSPIYEERPDNAIRLAAAVKVIEWSEGKPRQRIEVESTRPATGAQAQADLIRMLARNPTLTAKVVNTIMEAAKNSEAIDIPEGSATTTPQPPDSQSEGSHR